MGKSAADSLLRQRGIPVVDTDLLARELVEPGQPALREITQTFGPGMLTADGTLNRKELGRLIFRDPAARAKLERILHPRIRERWRAQADEWRNESQPIGVVVIPLLFETKAQTEVDETICVACSPATQLQRLLSRSWSSEEIQSRISSQLSIEEKVSRADYVIWNEATLPLMAEQLDLILKL